MMSERLLRQDDAVAKRIFGEFTTSLGSQPPVELCASITRSNVSVNLAQSPDAILESRIEQAFRTTGLLPLRNLEVFAAEGIVMLRGVVPTYHMKQVAQATALGIAEVTEVRNELEVITPERIRRF